MGDRTLDSLDGRQFLRNEIGDLMHRLARHDDHKVKSAGHQINCMGLREAIDPFRHGIEADIPLGSDFDLDQGEYVLIFDLVPIDDGFVLQNNLVAFGLFYLGGYFSSGRPVIVAICLLLVRASFSNIFKISCSIPFSRFRLLRVKN